MPPINAPPPAIIFHGNYVGPGWSSRKRQKSVAYGTERPIDEFDATGYWHDTRYALGADLDRADEIFYIANSGKGFKRDLAGNLVGAQSWLRRWRSGNKQTSTEISFLPEKDMALSKYKRGKNSRKTVRRSKPKSKKQYRRKSSKKTKSWKRKRTYKKKRLQKKNFRANTGITKTLELNLPSKSDQNCLYIGHSIIPRDTIQELLARAIVKRWAMVMRIELRNWAENLYYADSVEYDTFWLYYKQTPDDIIRTYSLNVLSTSTYENLYEFLYEKLGLISQTYDRAELVSIEYTPDPDKSKASFCRVPLDASHVTISVESVLKLQNRTVASSTMQEADYVNRQPVHIRLYSGYGNGLHKLQSMQGGAALNDDYPIVADNNGIIRVGSQPSGYNTLAPKTGFAPRPRFTKDATVSPGRIWMDKLFHKINGTPTWIMTKYLFSQSINDSAYIPVKGKYHIYGIEHLVQAGDTVDQVTVAGEVKQRYYANMTVNYSHTTYPIGTKVAYT